MGATLQLGEVMTFKLRSSVGIVTNYNASAIAGLVLLTCYYELARKSALEQIDWHSN